MPNTPKVNKSDLKVQRKGAKDADSSNAVVELIRLIAHGLGEALRGSVPGQRPMLYSSFLICTLSLAGGVLLVSSGIAKDNPSLQKVTVVSCVVVFLFGIGALLYVVCAPQRREANGSHPEMLQEFVDLVVRSKEADLRLTSFCCPDSKERAIPNLDGDKFMHRVIYHLWADPEGSSISAHFVPDESASPKYHLQVDFNNRGAYRSNVAIRPAGRSAFKNDGGDQFLCMELKVIPGEGRVDSVAVAFRICDRFLTQWVWGEGMDARTYYLVPPADLGLSKGDWAKIGIPLQRDESSARKFFVFPEDGNHLYPAEKTTPWGIVPFLVVEMGNGEDPQGPGRGCGRLLIRNIHFGSEYPSAIRPH